MHRSMGHEVRDELIYDSDEDFQSEPPRFSKSSKRGSFLNETMPTEDIILTGTLEKKTTSSSNSWDAKYAVLTSADLYFANPEMQHYVTDRIPLYDIISVGRFRDLENLSKAPEGNKRKSVRKSKKRGSNASERTHLTFVIQTDESGMNNGRTYIVQAINEEEYETWFRILTQTYKAAIKRHKIDLERQDIAGSKRRWLQINALKLYKKKAYIYSCSTVILLAYIMDLYEAEDNYKSSAGSGKTTRLISASILRAVNVACSLVFIFELFILIAAHTHDWRRKFVLHIWNSLDAFIIVMSVFATLFQITMLRPIRILRILRVLGRLRSFRRILWGLMKAMRPVVSALGLLMVVTCCYAVLATNLYGTAKQEFFGSMSASVFTMFQIATGDSWASYVARPTYMAEKGGFDRGVALFFSSYVLVTSVILVNVVVAVLLDELIQTITAEKQAAKEKADEELQKKRQAARATGSLDPVIESLSKFNDKEDLLHRIDELFQRLDIAKTGYLTMESMNEAFDVLPLPTRVQLSQDDFALITQEMALCNEEGEVDKEQFAVIMIKEIQRFSQRETLNSMGEGDDVQRSMFLTMKLLFLEFESLQEQDDSHEELEEDVARINERIAGLAKTLKTLTEHASRQVREGSAHLQNGDKSSGHGVGRSDKQPSRKRLEGPEGLEGNKAHGAVARERGRREKTEEPASEGREKGHGKRRSEPPRSQRRSDQINKFQQLKKAIENIRKISQQDAQLEISRAVRTLNLEQSDLVLVGGSSQTTPRDQCLQLAQALSTSSAILKSHRPATLLDEQERNPSP